MSNYDFICEMEAINVYKRFLPYSIGTPSRNVTYDNCYDRANFIFFSDSHIDFTNAEESLDNVKRTVEFCNNSPIKFDAMIHAGDIITPFYEQTKEQPLKNAKAFFDAVKESKSPVLYAKGNHDLNDWWNKPQNVLDDNDFSALFFDYAEENYGIVRQKKANGCKSTWNYYDLEEKKIRIICVDTNDIDKTVQNEDSTVKYFAASHFYIGNEQMNWIAKVALDFDDKEEKDWGVIVVFHNYPKNREEYENAVDKLLDLCVAFNSSSKYENHFECDENPCFKLDISADFTRYANEDKRPHIICWLLGHIHEDRHVVKKGINIIYTLNGSATNECGDARVARVLGTATQNSFDILNIDTRERKIRLFKYGAGKNCYGIGGDRFVPEGLDY